MSNLETLADKLQEARAELNQADAKFKEAREDYVKALTQEFKWQPGTILKRPNGDLIRIEKLHTTWNLKQVVVVASVQLKSGSFGARLREFYPETWFNFEEVSAP